MDLLRTKSVSGGTGYDGLVRTNDPWQHVEPEPFNLGEFIWLVYGPQISVPKPVATVALALLSASWRPVCLVLGAIGVGIAVAMKLRARLGPPPNDW
jgi:hypothetical protein